MGIRDNVDAEMKAKIFDLAKNQAISIAKGIIKN
jgi:hypothetical protein